MCTLSSNYGCDFSLKIHQYTVYCFFTVRPICCRFRLVYSGSHRHAYLECEKINSMISEILSPIRHTIHYHCIDLPPPQVCKVFWHGWRHWWSCGRVQADFSRYENRPEIQNVQSTGLVTVKIDPIRLQQDNGNY